MMSSTREAKEYTEVVVVLKELSQDDFNKIPRNIIDFLNAKRDKNYNFNININAPLEGQNISEQARMILAILFRDYLATDKQKEKIMNFEKAERMRMDEEAKKQYFVDNIFQKRKSKYEDKIEKEGESLIEYKEENIFIKIWNKIKQILKK